MMHNSWSRCLMIFANPVFKQKSTTIVTQPKVKLASKFERKFDQRTFVDKKGLFDGVSFSWICDRLLHFPPISQLPTPLLFYYFFQTKRVESIQTIVISTVSRQFWFSSIFHCGYASADLTHAPYSHLPTRRHTATARVRSNAHTHTHNKKKQNKKRICWLMLFFLTLKNAKHDHAINNNKN